MNKGKRLRLDRERRKFLGVCAGIAEYLEVEPWSVRLVFVVAVLMGTWFLVPAYFVTWLVLGNTAEGLGKSTAIKHLRNVDYRKRLYRNTEEGKFLGVCAGIADYLEVDVTVIRIVTLVLLFVAGPIPWLAYFAAWFVLDKRPHQRVRRPGDLSGEASAPGMQAQEEPALSLKASRRDIKRCARKFSTLHRRLSRMEAWVTSPRFQLHSEFRDMS